MNCHSGFYHVGLRETAIATPQTLSHWEPHYVEKSLSHSHTHTHTQNTSFRIARFCTEIWTQSHSVWSRSVIHSTTKFDSILPVKQSVYRPGQTMRASGGWNFQDFWTIGTWRWQMLSTLRTGRLYPIYPYCRRFSQHAICMQWYFISISWLLMMLLFITTVLSFTYC
jgi:hypothetical protein